ncbi:Hsp20/alpha crystallin family protein [Paludisphaera borealis]|uniref:18 kDa heat shock protein n=1 Tax=Paludisphaera borealis TaxID=1387353 RepID=A0A1U7CKT2_9BACT|nr:Hsp20/alpha crystallin family protein [Paludisphaera borealis]APW59542.1 18 kDa heat shock protein [Paludisphaera borealis]MDR3621848.1 Hsp20/alpha crystallin family protein [Paludisphaera borealis]
MSVPNSSIRVAVGSASSPPGGPPRAGDDQEARPAFTPPIDIHDGPDGLTLEADLPGATESNLHIQLEDNVLSLYAKIDSPAPESARLIHQEYPVGDYHRSFILSDEVDRERITAELKNGVLRIFLPKADRARARRIEIKS